MNACMDAPIFYVFRRTVWTYGVAKVRAAAATPVAITVLLDTPSAVACSEHTEDTGARDLRARLGALRLNAVAACSMQRPANIIDGLYIYIYIYACAWVCTRTQSRQILVHITVNLCDAAARVGAYRIVQVETALILTSLLYVHQRRMSLGILPWETFGRPNRPRME